MSRQPVINLSPSTSDSVKQTTCYMCACRCGIDVHFKDGELRYIAGNKSHPVNKGVLCGKGASGIMKQLSPGKLQKPLLRVGERGEGKFREIEWDEALAIATDWLGNIRQTDPKKLAFFTGRDQSQALTGWWAEQFGTPNYAAHGGFCSVNMAAAGLYSIGGSFWEFGEPDWERTKYFMMFGVAEDHSSNPIKIGLSTLRKNGAKFVSVNPVRTGYSAIADEWLGIRPGTDGLFVGALIRELLLADKVDAGYLARYTNAPWLVIQAPGAADDGLFARDEAGHPLCFDGTAVVDALLSDITPRLAGEVTLADGRRAVPSFQLLAARFIGGEYAAENVAERCGIPVAEIRRIAAELAKVAFEQEIRLDVPWTDWAGRRHDHMIGRPVSFHAMRGISAHANGFHTCRLIHTLQMLLGAIDCPGGFRYKPPYPRPAPPAIRPGGRSAPGEKLQGGPPLGFPIGPENLLVDEDGVPIRIDHAFSWEAPVAAHGLLHLVIANAHDGNPYKIDTLLLYMANMAWNSAMNVPATLAMLTAKDESGEYKIPHIIYSDAFYSETVAYADLILPDTTYLERHDCISLLDRPISDGDGPADSIRQPIIEPDRDVRPFQSVLLDLGARLGLPGMVQADGSPAYPGGFADYMVNHQRRPGIGMLAGWRGPDGQQELAGAPNPRQLEAYVANGCFWKHDLKPEQRFYKHSNKAYLDWAVRAGFIDRAEPIVLQLYSEPMQRFRLAAQGHGKILPPERHRVRVATYFDPLPFWYAASIPSEDYPLAAITQRPMIMYHSWDSQNAWQRQILGQNKLYIHHATAAAHGISDGDWVWAISPTGRVKGQAKLMDGCEPGTVWTWNAIGKRSGAWNLAPDAAEARLGFLLNHLIPEHLGDGHANADPVTGQAAWYDLRVRLEKAGEGAISEPQFATLHLPPLPARVKVRR